jgi:hypothetical protein
MAEARERDQGPPTYYANVVTSLLTADELTMELRRLDRPHRDISKQGLAPTAILPPVPPAEIMNLDPIARVVLTFQAAKALKEYLDGALPRMEVARKTGTLQ